MKKVFALLTAFVFVGLVACGPSAEEKKAQEEAAQRADDSVANSLLKQAAEAAPADSTVAPADSAAAAH